MRQTFAETTKFSNTNFLTSQLSNQLRDRTRFLGSAPIALCRALCHVLAGRSLSRLVGFLLKIKQLLLELLLLVDWRRREERVLLY